MQASMRTTNPFRYGCALPAATQVFSVKCKKAGKRRSDLHQVIVRPDGAVSFPDHGSAGPNALLMEHEMLYVGEHTGCYYFASILLSTGRADQWSKGHRVRRTSAQAEAIKFGISEECFPFFEMVSRRRAAHQLNSRSSTLDYPLDRPISTNIWWRMDRFLAGWNARMRAKINNVELRQVQRGIAQVPRY